jgi:5-methylcytosine-specific restriction endonuclease McrA
MNEKRCPKCGAVKPLTNFHKDSSKKDGLKSHCKACHNASRHAYQAAHPEQVATAKRAWRVAHREKEAHPEQVATHVRAYYETHHGEVLARNRAWKAAHREEDRARSRAYRQAHPDKEYTRSHRRRARKRNAEGSFTSADIMHFYNEQGGCCRWCSKPLNDKYHIDHIIPLSRWGTNWPANLVLACARCNLSKKDKLPFRNGSRPTICDYLSPTR